MRVDFLQLFIQDFKSFLGEHQFKLDKRTGLWFVQGINRDEKRLGSNGAGKSSLWDALCWCLYGVTPGGLRNPDVRPWRGATGRTKVSVLVMIDGKKRRTITRAISPNSLQIDGRDVTTEAIEKLIGMSFEILTNTIVLGQGRSLFFDLPPAAKMNMLSEAKRLDRWDGRSMQASARAKELLTELATVDGEITGLRAGYQQIEDGIASVEKEERLWRKQNEQARAKAAKFLKTATKKLERLEAEAADADLKYDGAMTEVKACERQISNLGLDVANAKSALATRLQSRASVEATIDAYNEQLKTLGKAKTCPTCGQSVKPKDLKKHTHEIEEQLEDWRIKLKNLSTRGRRTALASAEDNLRHEQSYLGTFHAKADGAMRTLKRKQEELADLRQRIRAAKEHMQENPHTQLLRDARKRLREMKQDITGAKSDKSKIEKEVTRAQYWSKGFKEIKLHVIEELLQELEITTAGMLEEVGLVDWRVKYQIERETKKGTVKRGLTILIGSPRSKGLVKWESWSGGEGQRLRVVGALALASVLLNHAGVEPNIEVLDEPTQHLSTEGVYDLCDFLADRARSIGRTIFYADQQSVDSARFAGVVTVRRGKAGSSVKTAVQ